MKHNSGNQTHAHVRARRQSVSQNGRLEHTDLSPEAGTTETQNLGTVHTGTLTLELELELELLLDAIPEA